MRVVPVRSAVTGSRPLLLILFIPHVSSSSTLQSVLPNSHFMCYEGGISVTAVLIAFQNDHCGDDLQIFSCHSVAHFKCLLARESIDQCFQGCGDHNLYHGVQKCIPDGHGSGGLVAVGATRGKRWTGEATCGKEEPSPRSPGMQERQTRWFHTDIHCCHVALAASPRQSPRGLVVTGLPIAYPTGSPEARTGPAFSPSICSLSPGLKVPHARRRG